MLKPLVLEFTDDIPRAQFWTGFTIESFSANTVYTFRIPEHLGKEAAYKRLSNDLGVSIDDVYLFPATPSLIMEWLKDHKHESQFRKGDKCACI